MAGNSAPWRVNNKTQGYEWKSAFLNFNISRPYLIKESSLLLNHVDLTIPAV